MAMAVKLSTPVATRHTQAESNEVNLRRSSRIRVLRRSGARPCATAHGPTPESLSQTSSRSRSLRPRTARATPGSSSSSPNRSPTTPTLLKAVRATSGPNNHQTPEPSSSRLSSKLQPTKANPRSDATATSKKRRRGCDLPDRSPITAPSASPDLEDDEYRTPRALRALKRQRLTAESSAPSSFTISIDHHNELPGGHSSRNDNNSLNLFDSEDAPDPSTYQFRQDAALTLDEVASGKGSSLALSPAEESAGPLKGVTAVSNATSVESPVDLKEPITPTSRIDPTCSETKVVSISLSETAGYQSPPLSSPIVPPTLLELPALIPPPVVAQDIDILQLPTPSSPSPSSPLTPSPLSPSSPLSPDPHRRNRVRTPEACDPNIWKLACQERVRYLLRRYGGAALRAVVEAQARHHVLARAKFCHYTPASYSSSSRSALRYLQADDMHIDWEAEELHDFEYGDYDDDDDEEWDLDEEEDDDYEYDEVLGMDMSADSTTEVEAMDVDEQHVDGSRALEALTTTPTTAPSVSSPPTRPASPSAPALPADRSSVQPYVPEPPQLPPLATVRVPNLEPCMPVTPEGKPFVGRGTPVDKQRRADWGSLQPGSWTPVLFFPVSLTSPKASPIPDVQFSDDGMGEYRSQEVEMDTNPQFSDFSEPSASSDFTYAPALPERTWLPPQPPAIVTSITSAPTATPAFPPSVSPDVAATAQNQTGCAWHSSFLQCLLSGCTPCAPTNAPQPSSSILMPSMAGPSSPVTLTQAPGDLN